MAQPVICNVCEKPCDDFGPFKFFGEDIVVCSEECAKLLDEAVAVELKKIQAEASPKSPLGFNGYNSGPIGVPVPKKRMLAKKYPKEFHIKASIPTLLPESPDKHPLKGFIYNKAIDVKKYGK